MSHFRMKPVVIEAEQFDGSLESATRIVTWVGGDRAASVLVGDVRYLDIVTLEGVMTAAPGDWIIRGVKGEFYPCKPDMFALLYEPVDRSHGSAEEPDR